MILVDSNIIIEYWRNPTEAYTKVFKEEDIAICGIVKAELIYGARNDKDMDKIISALDCFCSIEIEAADWIGIGRLLNILRKNGIHVPFQDAILAYLALKNDIRLWTSDKHFELIKGFVGDLKIYNISLS